MNPSLSLEAKPVDDPQRDAIYRKVMLRFLPLLCLCLVAAYLDRVNVGFAKLTMLDDLGLATRCTVWVRVSFFWVTSCSKCRAMCCFIR